MSSSVNWELKIDDVVFKTLKKIPTKNREALLSAIKLLETNPYYGDLQKMQGEENSWRRRVGSYRIFYKIQTEEKIILVFKLKRRTSNTY